MVLSHVQESMETKTDMEPDIHLTVQPTMTVSEVQKEVEKRMGWLPTNQLKRCITFLNTWMAIHSLGPLGHACKNFIASPRRSVEPFHAQNTPCRVLCGILGDWHFWRSKAYIL